jgi:hypothetical protein
MSIEEAEGRDKQWQSGSSVYNDIAGNQLRAAAQSLTVNQ